VLNNGILLRVSCERYVCFCVALRIVETLHCSDIPGYSLTKDSQNVFHRRETSAERIMAPKRGRENYSEKRLKQTCRNNSVFKLHLSLNMIKVHLGNVIDTELVKEFPILSCAPKTHQNPINGCIHEAITCIQHLKTTFL
jgi:hypothetical protein